jgi:TPR repeat protein
MAATAAAARGKTAAGHALPFFGRTVGEWRTQAESPNASVESLVWYYTSLYCGYGMSRNVQLADSVMQRAGATGDALCIGICHFGGYGRPLDYARAARIFAQEAAKLPVTPFVSHAKLELALVYQYGWGLPQDTKAANKLFREAAEEGHPVAQRFLTDNTVMFVE